MISKNGIALTVLLIEALLSALGVEFDAGTVERAIEGTLIAASLILMVWNQINREDVRLFLFKNR